MLEEFYARTNTYFDDDYARYEDYRRYRDVWNHDFVRKALHVGKHNFSLVSPIVRENLAMDLMVDGMKPLQAIMDECKVKSCVQRSS